MAYRDDCPTTAMVMYESRTVNELKGLAAHLVKVARKMTIGQEGGGGPFIQSSPPSLKGDLVRWIERLALNDAYLEGYYGRMSSIEKAALQEVVHSGDGDFDSFRFKAKYGSVPQISSPSYVSYRRGDDDAFPSLSFLLASAGKMPPDLQSRLKRFVPKPGKPAVSILDELPEAVKVYGGRETTPLVRHDTEQAAIQDVMAVLHLVDMGKVGVGSKTGRISQPGAAAITRVLSNGDFYPDQSAVKSGYDVEIGPAGIRPFAWAMLLQAANLANAAGSKLELTRTGRLALKKGPHEIIAILWRKWLKNKMLHEMNRIEVIKGQKSAKHPLAAAEPARFKIGDALSELEEGRWVRTEDFFKFLIAAGHGFDVVRNAWALYIGELQYGSFGYSHIGWEHTNGRFARAFLLEYAATLGLIDVALVPPWGALGDHADLWGAGDLSCLSRYDGLWGLRLNSLGAWVLGRKDKYVASYRDESSLRVLPNLEITGTGPSVSASDGLFLDRICQKVSEQVWRLSLPRALQAMEEGVDAGQIISFVEEGCVGDLPRQARDFLDDLASRTKKLRDLGEARIIECADVALARLIAGDSRLRDLCFPAGDRLLVVPKGSEAAFRKALRELGYVPGMV